MRPIASLIETASIFRPIVAAVVYRQIILQCILRVVGLNNRTNYKVTIIINNFVYIIYVQLCNNSVLRAN